MRLNIILLIIISQINFVFGQNEITTNKIDSIYKKLQTPEYFNPEGFANISTLYHQSKEINYVQGQIKTLQRMAAIRVGSSKFNEGIKYNNEAKTLALETQNYDSYITSCFIEANIYIYDHNYTQATAILNEASKYLEKINDLEKRRISHIAIDWQRWSIIHKSKSHKASYYKELLEISERIYKQAVLIKDPQINALRTSFSSTWSAWALIEEGNLKKAEYYLEIAKKQRKTNGINSFSTADYYHTKGDYEYKNKTNNKFYLDSTLANYKKAYEIANKLKYNGLTKVIAPKIAKIYGEKGDYDHQKKYTEEGEEISEKLASKINQNLNLAKPALYHKNTTDRKDHIFLYIGGSFCITAILFFFYTHYKLKKTRTKNTGNKNNAINLTNLTKRTIPINNLLTLVKDKDHSFYLTFLKEYPEFSEKLLAINPTIKNSDIEFCAFIKLNLDTKQIAVYKNMSVRAVEGKKYRIRKKLNITSDENMYIWLSKL